MKIKEAITKKRDLEATINALVNQFIKETGLLVSGIKVASEDFHGDKFCSEVEVEVML